MHAAPNDDPSPPRLGNQPGDPAPDGGTGHTSDSSRALIDLNQTALIDWADGAAATSGSPKGAPGDAEVMMDEGGTRYFDGVFGISDGVGVPNRELENKASVFQVGDMVWAKVKSHPWWPGQIFNEAVASPSVRRTKREGHLLVAFFGDSSYGWFDSGELVPFCPHFAEKSKQSTLRYFVCAVQEAVAEISRRESLALACYCRNDFNFQPARVQGYFYVDIAGFEQGAIYSSEQISTARDKFVPEKALSFLQQLALDPFSSVGLDQAKGTSILLAYRRAIFEEFDDTYAQAFGVEPVRPSRPSRPTGFILDRPERFTSRATPLRGEQIVPGASRKKSSSKPSLKSAKARQSAKKNKYLLKRRDRKQGSPLVSSDPPLVQAQPTIAFHESSSSSQGSSKLDDYVLQKRPPSDVSAPPQTSHDGGASPTPVMNDERVAKIALEIPAPDEDEGKPKLVDGSQLKKAKKTKKRQREDGSFSPAGVGGTVHAERRKKKGKKTKAYGGGICLPDPLKASEDEDAASPAASPADEPSALPDNIDDSIPRRSELLELIGDLHDLALGPLYVADYRDDHGAPSVALKFRSLVYENLDVSPAGEAEDEAEASTSPVEVDQAGGASLAAPAPAPAPQEPVRETIEVPPPPVAPPAAVAGGGRQRSPSDRQEETSAKRQKKLKAPPGEKKATSSPRSGAAATPADPSTRAAAAVAEPAPPPPPPLLPSPTALVMKFPPRTTLPSVASLKARFARFGPLELSGIRVLWKSNTCRVVYKFKPDAESALSFATTNDIFGRINVQYHLRDAAEGESRPAEGLQLRTGNGTTSINIFPLPNHNKHRNSMPLRSILKKPADIAGTRNTGRGARRVRFMLGSGSGSPPPPPPQIPPPPVEAIVSKSPNPAAFLPPLQPPLSTSSLLPPPLRPPPRNVDGFAARWRRGGAEGDFADQMLSLLMRCRDIVSNVKSSMGYVPYRLL